MPVCLRVCVLCRVYTCVLCRMWLGSCKGMDVWRVGVHMYNMYLHTIVQLNCVLFSLQYFETDDPELYTTKIKYIKENDVSDLELVFAEEVFSTSANADPEVGKYAVCVYYTCICLNLQNCAH